MEQYRYTAQQKGAGMPAVEPDSQCTDQALGLLLLRLSTMEFSARILYMWVIKITKPTEQKVWEGLDNKTLRGISMELEKEINRPEFESAVKPYPYLQDGLKKILPHLKDAAVIRNRMLHDLMILKEDSGIIVETRWDYSHCDDSFLFSAYQSNMLYTELSFSDIQEISKFFAQIGSWLMLFSATIQLTQQLMHLTPPDVVHRVYADSTKSIGEPSLPEKGMELVNADEKRKGERI